MIKNGAWNYQLLCQLLPPEIISHIVDTRVTPCSKKEEDKPIWMLESNEEFIVRCTYQYIRHRENKNMVFKEMWIKGLPFKMVFLMWRLSKGKIPVEEKISKWGIQGP